MDCVNVALKQIRKKVNKLLLNNLHPKFIVFVDVVQIDYLDYAFCNECNNTLKKEEMINNDMNGRKNE